MSRLVDRVLYGVRAGVEWRTAVVLAVLVPGAALTVPGAAVGAPPRPADVLPKSPTMAPSGAAEAALLKRAGLPVGGGAQAPPGVFAVPAPPAPAAPAAGADVIVNDPTDDTPERTTQSETSLAVRGNTLCAGYNTSSTGTFSGLSRSGDLGSTWADLNGIGQSGDPSVAVNQSTGTFYYAELATIGGNSAIGVARSTDDCRTFGAPVDASAGSSGLATTNFSDKPWIAVDNTGGVRNGNLYVCWTRFIDSNNDGQADASELRFSRSTDGGATYVGEQVLSPTGTNPFGCSVAVGPTGQVYVSWADRAGATANDIRFRRSTDGGVTFAAAVSVSTGNRHPGIDRVVSCGTNNNRPTLTGDIRMLHQAWMAVDTTGSAFNGNIYVVWASDPTGTPDNSDAFFSRSTNGGATWSAPTQVGAGGGATDQFEPFVAVAGAGAVSIAWYDRRNDAANDMLIDVFKTFSRDGGATLDPIARVTDQSFGVPPINPNFDPGVVRCYMGEYIAVAGDEDNFYYLWGDNRNILTTTAFPNGRPDPDVFFEREPSPLVFNRPPVCTGVRPSSSILWPPNHALRSITLSGATDPDGDPLTLTITGVTQDEPLNGDGDGNTSPDARLGPGSNRVSLRAERSGKGDGRVYRITFSVSDGRGGTCSGSVTVGVPHDQGRHRVPVDSGQTFNSLG